MACVGLWDIFCRVIDNHGDLGVSWRLSAELATRGHQVRLWADDARALAWMAPGALEGRWAGVTVRAWDQASDAALLAQLPRADVWVETFGCDIPEPFVSHHAHMPLPAWVNLEYLSAEDYVERSHGLPSPILHGPAAGHTRWFFFPGLTPRTGGLLHGDGLQQAHASFDRAAWLRAQGITWHGEPIWSLFCYEPPALPQLLTHARDAAQPPHLLVTAGRASEAVRRVSQGMAPARMSFLPALPQTGFNHLLWACDLNFVRGEDSLVRAILAGKPWIWQIYPQSDEAHRAKLEALMARLELPLDQRGFQRRWNDLEPGPLPPPRPEDWRATAAAIRTRLLQQSDLCTRLLDFLANRNAWRWQQP